MKKGRFYSRYVIEKELRHHVIEWGATILAVAGAIVNAVKYIEGFYLFIIANILWMIFAVKHKHYGLLVMNIVFLLINFFALWFWYSTGFGSRFF